MTLNKALGTALKQVRNATRLTQEDFSQVSSRTYMSTLERGLKSPTLEKLDQIAQVMGVHPLTILVLAYSRMEKKGNTNKLLNEIQYEIDNISS